MINMLFLGYLICPDGINQYFTAGGGKAERTKQSRTLVNEKDDALPVLFIKSGGI